MTTPSGGFKPSETGVVKIEIAASAGSPARSDAPLQAATPRLRGEAAGSGAKAPERGLGMASRSERTSGVDRFFDRHEQAAREAPKGTARRAIEGVKTTDFFGERNAARLEAARAAGDGVAEKAILGERQQRLDLMRDVMRSKDVHPLAHHPDLSRAAEAMRNSPSWQVARGRLNEAYEALAKDGRLVAERVPLKGQDVHHMHFKAIYRAETLNTHNLAVAGERHTDAHRATGGSPEGKNNKIFSEMNHMMADRPEVRAEFRDYYYFHNPNATAPLSRGGRGAGEAGPATVKERLAAFNRALNGETLAEPGRATSRREADAPNEAPRHGAKEASGAAERRAFDERVRAELRDAARKETFDRATGHQHSVARSLGFDF